MTVKTRLRLARRWAIGKCPMFKPDVFQTYRQRNVDDRMRVQQLRQTGNISLAVSAS